MTALTRTQLTTEVNTNFPDNTSGLITPAIARQTFGVVVDGFITSFATLADTNTFAPASGVAITINAPASTNTAALNITQSGPTSGTTAGPVNLNLINVTGYNATTTGTKFSDFGAWSSSIVGFRVNFTAGGSNITSSAEPFMGILGHVRVTTATNAGQIDFEGVTGITYTNVNINSATMEGVVGAIVIDNGGTANIVAGLWGEADIRTGGTATERYGVMLDSEGDLTASGNDAAIGMAVGSTATAFKKGILLKIISGTVSPIQTSGDFVASTAALTINNVFSCSNWTVSTNIFNFPNFLVTGAGVGTFGPNNAAASGVQLVVNKNTAQVPLGGLTNVAMQIGGAAASNARLEIITAQGIPIINFVRSEGTFGSPTATQNNNFIGAFGAFGYGQTAYGTGGGGGILFKSTENWSDTAQGACVIIQTTPNTTATAATALTVQHSGGLSVGTSTDGGIGTVWANKSITAHNATAIPAGGTAGAGFMVSSTANFGVFFGSGAPSLSAAKGSLYLRSDGSTTNDRAYINTNGSTTWTALTTVA